MTTSEQIGELATALSQAQGEMAGAVKDSANPFFRSKYADLASVREALRLPFLKHGLAVVQCPQTEYTGTPEPYEWTAKSGETRHGVRVICIVSVLTRLIHTSGQWIEGVVSTMLPTGDPQAVGSAITYLRRYALQSVAGVAPEDDDAEAAHHANANANPPSIPINQDQAGARYLRAVHAQPTKNPNVTKYMIVDEYGEGFSTIKEKLAHLCEALIQDRALVTLDTTNTKWGKELVAVHRVPLDTEPATVTDAVTAEDIPF